MYNLALHLNQWKGMQEKGSKMVVQCRLKMLSLGIPCDAKQLPLL